MEKYSARFLEESRHMFIYDENNGRQEFIKQLESEFPIKTGENSPMAIYMKDLYLPKIEKTEDIDKIKVAILTRDYFEYSIAREIVKKIYEQIDLSLLNDRINNILIWFGRENSSSINKLEALKILLQGLEESVNFYSEAYSELVKTGDFISDMSIPIPYINVEGFTRTVQNLLNNQSHFGIIIDQQDNLSIELQRAINWLVGKRINGRLSIKVFTKEQDWKTYYDLNGTFIEAVHDYEVIKINSLNKF